MTANIQAWLKKAGLLLVALAAAAALFFASVLASARVAPAAFATSCWPEADVKILSRDGNTIIKEAEAGRPVVISAEFDPRVECPPGFAPNMWIIEAKNSDRVEFIRWQSILPEKEDYPYRISTEWVPAQGDNYEITARIVVDRMSYCSRIEPSHANYGYCKNNGSAVFRWELGSGKADLVVLGDMKGIMRDLRAVDRFDTDNKLTKIPVGTDSVLQVTLRPMRWPAASPSFLTFEIFDSKGRLVYTKVVYEPIKQSIPMFIHSPPGVFDAFSSADWVPSKADRYTIKATLTDSLTEPKLSTHISKAVRVVNR
ncbi:hypothetical protein [Nitrososphaera sp.]|uniref:hypothetical protein n=1 Tax=Nitrososphaera sp. TaxID=1971748 RepID=UPI00307E5EA2